MRVHLRKWMHNAKRFTLIHWLARLERQVTQRKKRKKQLTALGRIQVKGEQVLEQLTL